MDPGRAMADLVRRLAAAARARRPGFLVLLNDGAPLVRRFPELAGVADGVVRESVTFAGRPSSRWSDPENADLPVPEGERRRILADLDAVRALGLAVFTLDYAADPAHRARAAALARGRGFLPFVSRTPLSRLPAE